jgi:transcriptional regulator with XRE-family HTH domain
MSDPTTTGGAPPRRTIAEKLNHLFDVVRPPGEDREYTGREVVAGVNAAGTDLSASHLSELRRGVKDNPTVRVLDGLANFFGVRVAYFLDPGVEEEVEAELDLRVAMRDAKVRDVAMRAADLDPQQRTAMHRLLAQIIREHDDQ